MSVHHDGSHQQQATLSGADLFDPSGYSSAETQPRGASTAEETDSDPNPNSERWHGGLDLGLLVLRLTLGATMIVHGLQKFGLFDGPGLGGFAGALEQLGYHNSTTLLAWVTALTEVGGGALLVLGLFTPLGAAAVLGLMANTVYVKFGDGFFASQSGFEYELLLAVVAFSLLCTGSGRAALDKNTPWRRKPLVPGLVCFVLAAVASVLVLVLCR